MTSAFRIGQKCFCAGATRGALYVWHQSNCIGGTVRAGPYKLIRRYDDNSLELFDLSVDIGEQRNLAVEKPEVAAKRNEQLGLWLKETTAQMPTRRD